MRTIKPERLLRVKRIRPTTLLQYDEHVQQFFSWCSNHNKKPKTERQIDTCMATYFNCLYEDGDSQNSASYTLFGWIALKSVPHGPERQLLPLSRAALSAWRGAAPGKSRVGVPPQVIFHFAWYCAQHDHVDAAAAVLLQYDSYARPSEILGVRGVDVIPPVGALSNCWGILFGNFDSGVPTKSGSFDDVVLTDSAHRSFAGKILKHISRWRKRSEGELFPHLTLTVYEGLFRDFSKRFKLPAHSFTPHVIRHSGPSYDILHRYRNLQDIQARGRWASASSVARYKKPGRMLLQSSLLPSIFQTYTDVPLQSALERILCHSWA